LGNILSWGIIIYLGRGNLMPVASLLFFVPALFLTGMVIYTFYLVITALKIYIKKNS